MQNDCRLCFAKRVAVFILMSKEEKRGSKQKRVGLNEREAWGVLVEMNSIQREAGKSLFFPFLPSSPEDNPGWSAVPNTDLPRLHNSDSTVNKQPMTDDQPSFDAYFPLRSRRSTPTANKESIGVGWASWRFSVL